MFISIHLPREDLQVDPLFDDLLLLFENFKLFRVVGAGHLCAIATDAG